MSRTETITRPLPPPRAEAPSTYEDQIRSYRVNQRRRHEAARRLNRLNPWRKEKSEARNTNQRLERASSSRSSSTTGRTLEQTVDPEVELNQSQLRRVGMTPAEVLYDQNWSNSQHRVYDHEFVMEPIYNSKVLSTF